MICGFYNKILTTINFEGNGTYQNDELKGNIKGEQQLFFKSTFGLRQMSGYI